MHKVNYNDISQVYDDVHQADVELINNFIQEVEIGPSTRIVDLGCGTGNYADLLQKITSSQVFGVEPSAGMLSKAKQKESAVLFKAGDATHVPFEDEYFDFGAHPDFVERGKQISYQSIALRKHMKDVNTNFVYLHRTRYGLIRLFEIMKARVRMWNPYEWEGEPDGQKKSCRG